MATKPAIPMDDVIRGCLDKIRRREMTAIGVLADHLDEISHPLAEMVRKDYTRADNAIRWTNTTAKWSNRKKRTRWENVCEWRKWLWIRIGQYFEREWQWKQRGKLKVQDFK